ADLRIGLEPAERQWYAELVVVARLRGNCAHSRSADRGEDVLGRGLAGRTGDPDDLGRAVGADRGADRAERRERVFPDEGGRRAARECVLTEGVPAADRDEEVAFLDPARVDLDAGHLRRPGHGFEPAGA